MKPYPFYMCVDVEKEEGLQNADGTTILVSLIQVNAAFF